MKDQNKKMTTKKWIIIALFIVAAVLSIITMGKIKINYNLADYLGKDTQTKIALDIIDEEFGMTGDIKVMAENVSVDTASEMVDKIKSIDNVINVNFDKYDETYYKDNNALFIVIIDGDDYSDNAKKVASDIKNALSEYEGIEYGGTSIEKQALQDAITNEMTYILVISLCLVVAILLITSESWLEPIILLVASGVAVLINRGTNIFFGEISYITNSISAILQLALSIDYSIVLLHTYKKEKELDDNNNLAMKKAIKSVVKPVSASALTTIAGLLALLFMSFRIGFDIGIVLMKGIVVSAITSMTLLPALILLFDKAMKKTKKQSFVPRGKAFCKVAYKASKIIVPIALIIIILCGVLQSKNTFIFSDTEAGNESISNTFGNNNTVVVIYKNSSEGYEKEKTLIDSLYGYKTKSNKSVLSNYTAYTNTVRELYDIDKAVKKLEISESDAEMLFTMYNLYKSQEEITLSLDEFIEFANNLIKTDDDAKEFTDDDTKKTIETLNEISNILNEDLTAEELYERLTTGVMEGTDISSFSIKQLYGLYFYNSVLDNKIEFEKVIDFIILASKEENTKNMFDEETITKLSNLKTGISQFEEQMEMLMTKEMLKGWFYQNYNVLLSEENLNQIYMGYFASTGKEVSETIPFLPLMEFLIASNTITDEVAIETINNYSNLYKVVNDKYTYDQFLTTLSYVVKALTKENFEINATNEAIQQIYIMYFYQIDKMPLSKIKGEAFVEFAISKYETNEIVKNELSSENLNKLIDMNTVYKYISDSTTLSYKDAYKKIFALSLEIKSDITTSALDEDKVSGVYIKYATNNNRTLSTPMMAYELLDFVTNNMDTNSLLNKKMTITNRNKVNDAKKDIAKAEDLFISENYSRMLLSVNLPNESEETTEFVEYLSNEVKNIFGDEAYIAGEIVSTYDLEKTFDHDNLFITIFTLISIFVIVMVIFKSLSLPIILVAIIQGAIFIAMSTQLMNDGIFFMSYIVSTCILMGATIDYGILMSSNYVAYRKEKDKKESLELSVQAAMPTVFTSGLILTVCGFVIHFISSQSSISTVGLLIGIGTICSVIMITIVLPSVLYLLDKFVLKLSIKKK